MYINWKRKEIIITIALYGPQGSGKSTTWRYWAQKASEPPQNGEDTFSLRTKVVQGKQIVLNIRDTPGGAEYASQRRVALYGADGLIFVADSSLDRQEANRQSMEELLTNLSSVKKSLHTMPFLFQYNKRDAAEAVTLEALQHSLNAKNEWPYRETCAATNEGMVEVLQDVTRLVLKTVLQRWNDRTAFYSR